MVGAICKHLDKNLDNAISEIKTKHNIGVVKDVLKSIVELWQSENKTEDFPPTDILIGKLFEHGGIPESSHVKSFVTSYTPKGKEKQVYVVKKKEDNSYGIFNKENKEVFTAESVDRSKIFANIGIAFNGARVVKHKGSEYVVSKTGEIVSVKTGKKMEWPKNNGDRKAIIAQYEDIINSSKVKSTSIENSKSIYPRLGKNTANNNIVISPVYQQEGVKYAKSINGIFSLRLYNTNKHFGNIFSHEPEGKTPGLIKTNTIKEAVEGFIDWVVYGNNAKVLSKDSPYYDQLKDKPESYFQELEERRQWILKQLKSGLLKNKPIVYYKELGEPSHATALDYLINKYDWSNIETSQIKQEIQEKIPFSVKDTFKDTFSKVTYSALESDYNQFKISIDSFINILSFNRDALSIKDLNEVLSSINAPRSMILELNKELKSRLNISGLIKSVGKGQLTQIYDIMPIQEETGKALLEMDFSGEPTAEDLAFQEESFQERPIDTYEDTMTINTDVENKKKQINYDYTAKKLQDRIDLMSLLFSTTVDNLVDEYEDKLDAVRQDLQEKEEHVDENIIDLLRPDSRQSLIYKETPKRIFDSIKKEIEKKRDKLYNKKSYVKAKEYDLMLKHFWDIAYKTAPYLGLVEGIKLNRNFESIVEDENIIEDDDISIESYDRLVNDPEEQSNREWDKNSRNHDASEGLSNSVRKILRMIPKVGFDGEVEFDDLGNPKMLNSSYAYRVLMQNLSKTLYKPDHLIEQLQTLAKKEPWVESVIQYIDYFSLEKDDPNYEKTEANFSQFFENFCKLALNYWIHVTEQDKSGYITTKRIQANKPNGYSFLIDIWRGNINQGIPLTKNSLYNHQAKFNAKKAEKTLARINELIKEIEDYESFDSLPDKIQEEFVDIIQSIGVRITVGELLLSINNNIEELTSLMELFKYPIEGIKEGKLDIKERADKSKTQEDLFSLYESKFKEIGQRLSNTNIDFIEDGAREGQKNWSTYTNSNYLGNLMKIIHSDECVEYMQKEFGNNPWFFYDGEWSNELIKDLIEDEEFRKNFDWKVLLTKDKMEFKSWGDLNTSAIMLNEYLMYDKPKEGIHMANYHMPIYSDTHSLEFLKLKRYTDESFGGRIITFEEKLMPLYSNLVKQEIRRIALVKNRHKLIQEGVIAAEANFDIEGPDNLGGSEFKFLPELNSLSYEDGTFFLEKYNYLIQKNQIEEAEQLIQDAVTDVLKTGYDSMITEMTENGLLETIGGYYKHFRTADGKLIKEDPNTEFIESDEVNENGEKVLSKTQGNRLLKEYYWNSSIATAQIIQLTTTDLAFYKNDEDFQKRFKEVHASGLRLNTLAKFGKEFETSIYLKDENIISEILEAVKVVTNAKDLDKQQKDYIISQFNKITVTDGQSFRTLESYRSILSMRGKLTKSLEHAFDRIIDNKWSVKDFNLVLNSIKPYVYTNIKKDDGFGQTMRVPTQHKNSEALLSMAHAVLVGNGVLTKSNKMTDLNQFMLDHKIDVVHFASVVKVGLSNAVDLNAKDPNDSYLQHLNKMFVVKNNGEEVLDPKKTHMIPYDDYIIQVETPPHFMDVQQLFGTQIRRLISSDIDFNQEMFIDVNGKKVKRTIGEWIKIMNTLISDNVEESYQEVLKIMGDIDSMSEYLISQIAGNPRYDQDLVEAFQVVERADENGVIRKEFARPINDPLVSDKIQSLIFSMFKNNVTRQKVRGGSMVQVSNVGYTDDLNIQFKDKDGNLLYTKQEFAKRNNLSGKELSDAYTEYLNKFEGFSVSHYECYMPWYTEKYLSKLIDKNSGTLDISKIKDKRLLELIGYRIPTEDTYSMVPLVIKGFLPQQLSGTIMLPADFVAISGSDFDIDKLYIMLNEFHEDEKTGELTKIVSKKILKEGQFDGVNRLQRNNAILDIMRGVLTHQQSIGKMLNPGNFNDIKRTANKVIIASNFHNDISERDQLRYPDLIEKVFKYRDHTTDIDGLLNKLSDKEMNQLASIFKKRINPLSPRTFVKFYNQNVAGGTLIGVYANHNTNHALMQRIDVPVFKNKFGLNYNKSLNQDKRWNLGNIKNGRGQFISKNISQFVAAAVDNAKDPILAFLNENDFTANASNYPRRLGFTIDEVAAVLTQPVIKEIVQYYTLNKKSGIGRMGTIMAMANKLGYDEFNPLPIPGSTNHDLYYALSLASKSNKTIKEQEIYDKTQAVALSIFIQMFKGGEILNQIVSGNRADTQAGALSFNIANSLTQVNKIEKFQEMLENPEPSIGVEGLIDRGDKHFLNAFSVAVTDGFWECNKYLKQCDWPTVDSVKKLINGTNSENFPEKLLNKYFKEMMTYYLSGLTFFGADEKNTYKEKFEHFTRFFPEEFNTMRSKHKDIEELSLIKKIEVDYSGEIPVLKFNKIGRLTSEQKQGYKIDWSSMLHSDNIDAKKMAMSLLLYNYFTNGLLFSPNGFYNLAPLEVTDFIPGYSNYISEYTSDKMNFDNFMKTFIRNHLHESVLAPNIKYDIPDDIHYLSIKKDPYLQDKVISSNGKLLNAFKIYKEGKVRYFMLEYEKIGTYIEVNPLNIKNKTLYYDMNSSWDDDIDLNRTQVENIEIEDPTAEDYDSSPVSEQEEVNSIQIKNSIDSIAPQYIDPGTEVIEGQVNLDNVVSTKKVDDAGRELCQTVTQ